MKKQQGVTLLELLIAVALGLIVISGVVRLVARTMDTERFSAADAEMVETVNYVSNRLGFIFKSAMSSPCGSLSTMMINENLRRVRVNNMPQAIPNVIITKSTSDIVRSNEFPMLAVGIAGNDNEPKASNGRPFSESLSGIVPGTQYLIVMESSEKLIVSLPNKLPPGMSSNITSETMVKNMTGSPNLAVNSEDNLLSDMPGIPVSDVSTRLNNKPAAFIITDCKNADIFYHPNAPDQQKNWITLPDNMNFSVGYKPSETIISPIEMYAYFISKVPGEDAPRLSRANLTLQGAGRPHPQPLVSGVADLKFEWGFGDIKTGIVQTYFTTEELLSKQIDMGTFLDSVISTRVEITVQGANAEYNKRTDKDGELVLDQDGKLQAMQKTVTRIYTLRNKMSRN